MQLKMCVKCNQQLPATTDYFHRHSGHKDGLQSCCKGCKSLYNAEWQRANPKYNSKYYLFNQESMLKKRNAYNHAHAEYLQGKRKDYYLRNKAKVLEHARRYRKERPEVGRKASAKYYQAKKQLSYSLTNEQWDACKKFFDYKCAYCGADSARLHREHFVPVSKNGAYDSNNIIPACPSCNAMKHTHSFFEWYPNQAFYSEEREHKILTYLMAQ